MTPDEMRRKNFLAGGWDPTGIRQAWKMVAEICERLEWLKPIVFVEPSAVEMNDLISTGPGQIVRMKSDRSTGARFCQDQNGCVWDPMYAHWVVRNPRCCLEHRGEENT